MSQYLVWQMDSTTLKVLKDIEDAIKARSLNLSTGGLLTAPTASDLSRAYSYEVGFIDGLEYLKKLLTESEDKDPNDDES